MLLLSSKILPINILFNQLKNIKSDKYIKSKLVHNVENILITPRTVVMLFEILKYLRNRRENAPFYQKEHHPTYDWHKLSALVASLIRVST